MTAPDGSPGEMDETLWPPRMRDPLQLDDGTVDRLLSGLPADDAPPRYRGVAELLNALSAASADELADERSTTETRPIPASQWVPPPRPAVHRRSVKRRLRVSGAALVGSATLFIGLGAAGALPGAAQGVAADVLATVGVDAPHPDAPVIDTSDTEPASSDSPVGEGTSSSGGSGKGATASGAATGDSTTGVDQGAAESSDGNVGTGNAGDDAPPADAGRPANAERPADAGPPNTPPGQANLPNGGVGNGKGNGNTGKGPQAED